MRSGPGRARFAALAGSMLLAFGAVAGAATPAVAAGAAGSRACPAAKSAKASKNAKSSEKSATGDMHMGHASSSKHAKMANCPTVAGAPEVAVTASAYSFSPNEITIEAGDPVTIVLTSTDLPHDLNVQGYGHVVHTKAKSTAEGGLKIDTPGTYKFWCTVKGHRANGMVGTITVTP